MIQSFARFVLKLLGWKTIGKAPDVPRFVIIAAPHTSNWDFLYALLLSADLGMRVKWVGKDTLFRFPFGGIMRALGGIGVDRSERHNYVDNIVHLLKNSERLGLIIPAEGTRSKTSRWKTGFYYIALGAQVPIVCGFVDYTKKEGGIGLTFIPSGDLSEDVQKLRNFYTGIQGKHPEQTSVIDFGENKPVS
jgi:1-acyl-sn-glycerol-3-phosphate acyltransferase